MKCRLKEVLIDWIKQLLQCAFPVPAFRSKYIEDEHKLCNIDYIIIYNLYTWLELQGKIRGWPNWKEFVVGLIFSQLKNTIPKDAKIFPV